MLVGVGKVVVRFVNSSPATTTALRLDVLDEGRPVGREHPMQHRRLGAAALVGGGARPTRPRRGVSGAPHREDLLPQPCRCHRRLLPVTYEPLKGGGEYQRDLMGQVVRGTAAALARRTRHASSVGGACLLERPWSTWPNASP